MTKEETMKRLIEIGAVHHIGGQYFIAKATLRVNDIRVKSNVIPKLTTLTRDDVKLILDEAGVPRFSSTPTKYRLRDISSMTIRLVDKLIVKYSREEVIEVIEHYYKTILYPKNIGHFIIHSFEQVKEDLDN